MHDDMRVERDIMVPMRDGIKLACDVYRPTAAGQTVPGAFPVILTHAVRERADESFGNLAPPPGAPPIAPGSRGLFCPPWLCRDLSRLSWPLWFGRGL